MQDSCFRVDLEDGSLAEESLDSSQAQDTLEDEYPTETKSKTEEEQIMTLFSINNDDSRFGLFC
jgi:hypothetical protein